MTRTIVIGDLHGDWRGLLAILRATGAIDDDGDRLPGTRVIQLGDLIHGGEARVEEAANADDTLCAGLALDRGLCDTVLIGNHELPLVWPDAGFPTWRGQRPLRPDQRDLFLRAHDRGVLVAATSVGDWLLTHAGLHPGDMGEHDRADECAAWLRDAFGYRVEFGETKGIFDGIGRLRGGRRPYGGIFWCDWRELTGVGVYSPIPQIVGHTPQGDAPGYLYNLQCVDVGAALSGRVAALITDDDGEHWEPVVVKSEG